MVKYFLGLLVAISVLTSCDDTPQRVLPKGKKPIIADKPFPEEKLSPIDIPPPPAPYTGPRKYCFEMELGNNTNEITRMQFVLQDNDSISGRLDYSFADRQAIHGNIEGVKEGKIIELLFAYADSGKAKTEQLVLRLEDNKLFRKTGPMVEDDGVLVLENPAKATMQLFLMKTNCK